MKKIELEPYKGVRDFYPEDNRLHRYIFQVWEKVAESYGYEKYNASVLEPLDLYKAKSSEEIVSEQIYTFKDRGERDVALRPEMTPTVARMVAARWQELPAPVRWYSIPNLFRYEKPQRGRLREHWQLNCDLFGVNNAEADAEIISLAADIMKKFGAQDRDYEIRINNREALNEICNKIGITADKMQTVFRVIDKKEKISGDAFREALKEVLDEEQVTKLTYIFDSGEAFFTEFGDNKSVQELKDTIESLRRKGFNNIQFYPTLTRGFDYYTGLVFEIFDTNPDNNRSLFGGGRYDNLVEQFGGEKVPAVGFGMGDVTIQDFLQTHNLLPALKSSTQVWLAVAPETDMEKINEISAKLREAGINVGVDISEKKLPDQLKSLERRNIPFVIVIGKDEIENNKFKLRNVGTREEKEGTIEEIAAILK